MPVAFIYLFNKKNEFKNLMLIIINYYYNE